ncbi:hypothetical protein [Pseudoduganella albidiflava]|uniref:hypothetical protein n=1 Tax=Pseudoduganella albidiflava TaxID=321983 RepID=UPI0013F163BC|nr:hypothetical protein [Pseudoduganella albidiflava]
MTGTDREIESRGSFDQGIESRGEADVLKGIVRSPGGACLQTITPRRPDLDNENR